MEETDICARKIYAAKVAAIVQLGDAPLMPPLILSHRTLLVMFSDLQYFSNFFKKERKYALKSLIQSCSI